MKGFGTAAVAVGVLGFSLGASAACNVTTLVIKDANGVAQTFCVGGATGALLSEGVVLDAGGVNTLSVNAAGLIGVSNLPTITTGSAVPAIADYNGINVGGNLRGLTGVNPSGTIYDAQIDVTSIGGVNATTSATGILEVGVVGHSGGVFDTTTGAALPTYAVAAQVASASLNTMQGFAQAVTSTIAGVTSTGAYVSGNCIGGFQSIVAAGKNGQSGNLKNVLVENVSGNAAPVTVYLFESSPTASTCTDHGTFAVGAADLGRLIAAPTQVVLAAPAGAVPSFGEIAFAGNGRPFVAGGVSSATTNISYALVAGGSQTAASTTDYRMKIGYSLN